MFFEAVLIQDSVKTLKQSEEDFLFSHPPNFKGQGPTMKTIGVLMTIIFQVDE